MKQIRSIKEIAITGKKVFLRTDYNVVTDGKITDPFRIESTLPTIRYLLKHDCSIVLASHNGRPDGKAAKGLSLEPVAEALSDLLDKKVTFVHDSVGSAAEQAAEDLNSREIILLENLRFHKEEEENGTKFGKALAELADFYVDDAFANIHRAHASMVGVPKHLPSAAGLLVEREYDTLTKLLTDPKRPFLAIIAGAKVSSKLEILHSLIERVDTLVIGGAMANTFLYAEGYNMGKSILEADLAKQAEEILHSARQRGVEILLPSDLVVAAQPKSGERTRIVKVSDVGEHDMALDLGPDTVYDIKLAIEQSKMVFWNGTVGYAELPQFAHASREIACAIADARAESIIGGGDTAGFIDAEGMEKDFDFVSTGGGASLELLSGKKMPALDVLLD